MEARLAALESGGGFDPKKGLFSALRGATLDIPPNSSNHITNEVEEFDLSNWYDAPNGLFRPKVPGYYRLSAYVHVMTTMPSGTYLALRMQCNGDSATRTISMTSPAGSFKNVISGTVIMKANGTTDSFIPALSHNHTSSIRVADANVSSGDNGTFFQGELIGAL
jgi:hypothetical protein